MENNDQLEKTIVLSFVELYRQRPTQAVTIQDIAAKAGVDMDTFKKYFNSIDEICDVIIDYAANKLINFIYKDYADYICNLRAKQDVIIAELKKNANFYLALSNFRGIDKLIWKVTEYANDYTYKYLTTHDSTFDWKESEIANYGMIMQILSVYIGKLQGRFKANWSELADWVTKTILQFKKTPSLALGQ